MIHIKNTYKGLKISSLNLFYVFVTNNENSFVIKNNKALDYLFHQINSSILAGEFIKERETFVKYLDKCDTELNAITNQYQDLALQYPNLVTEKITSTCFNFVRIIGNCLEQLAELKYRVSSFFKRGSKEILLNRSLESEKIENFALSLLSKHIKAGKLLHYEKTKMCYELLGINKQVFILDFFLEVNKKSYYRLEFYENQLIKLDRDVGNERISFIAVLLEKVMFLKLKLLLRFKKNYSERGNVLKLISEMESVGPNSMFSKLMIPQLKDHLEYANSHYIDAGEAGEGLFERYGELRELSTLRATHCKIKFFKDIERNEDELKKLVENLSINSSSKYQNYVTTLAKVYSLNNRYSFIISQSNISMENAIKEYEVLTENLKRLNFNNFFGEHKLLEYLNGKIEKLLEDDDVGNNIKLFTNYLLKYKDALAAYEKNINWFGYNYSFLFPLPYEEAFISDSFTANNKVSGVFISSGFCLPLDNQQYLEELSEYKQKLLTYNSIFPQIEKLHLQISKVKKLEQEQEYKDSKYIEILGIFSSIIIFASAAFGVSIDLSKYLDAKNTLLSFISIGIVLILFLTVVLLIAKFSLRKLRIFLSELNFENKKLIGLLVVIFIGFLVICYKLVSILEFIINEIELISIFRIA